MYEELISDLQFMSSQLHSGDVDKVIVDSSICCIEQLLAENQLLKQEVKHLDYLLRFK